MSSLETRGVLAGAYARGKRGGDMGKTLTHSVEVDDQGNDVSVLCKRVPLEHMADTFAFDRSELDEAPRCPTCNKRWSKRLVTLPPGTRST